MKSAWILFALLFACSSTHELLMPMDGGVDVVDSAVDSGFDGALPDAGADASECGPPPPITPTPCLEFVDDREGVFCCRDAPRTVECRDGSWQCPLGWFEASMCNISAATCPWFECSGQDAHTSPVGVECAGLTFTQYVFDGRACRPLGFGCSFTECVGRDCDSLYEDLDACVMANSDCGAGSCEAMDVGLPAGAICDGGVTVSWQWNGWACQRHEDCADGAVCTGADCASLYATEAACQADRAGCIDRCDATDAALLCEGERSSTSYFVWNGHTCVHAVRCSEEPTCTGSECDQVYTSVTTCLEQHRHCVGPAPVVDRGAISCRLSQEEVVESAVRLSACDVATANDVIAGYFELQLALPTRSVSPGYVPDCDVMRCGASANSCAELDVCLASARERSCTPASLPVCVGTEIWQCGADLSIRNGDCATIGGACAMEPTSGDREIAYCETPGNPGPVTGLTWCDRDELVINVGGESVRFACSEYLPGTECRDVLFASEFPGVACGYPDPVCSEYAASAVSCSGAFAELCVGGQPRLIDCVAEGYSGCEFGAGCIE